MLDGGAEMADDLTRLAALGGVPAYREEAAGALAAYAGDAAASGPQAAPWALAVMRFSEHPTHIVVVGRRGDAQAGALLRAGLRIAEPLRSVQLLDPDADAEAIAREGYTVAAGTAAAFVCLAGVCLAPTSDPARLAGAGRPLRPTTEALAPGAPAARRSAAGDRIVRYDGRRSAAAAAGRGRPRGTDEARCACSRSTRPNGARSATGCARC